MMSKQKPLFIFDLDHTLYDTQGLTRDFQKAFSRYGIPERIFNLSYRRVVDNFKIYHPRRHILYAYRLIGKKAGLRAINLLPLRQNLYRRRIFLDVKPFLRWAKKHFQLVLLTYGSQSFQREKIMASGLRTLFHRIIITKNSYKIADLKRLIKNRKKPAFFVEDDILALRKVKKALTSINLVHLHRYGSHKKFFKNIPTVPNLNRLKKLLVKQYGFK